MLYAFLCYNNEATVCSWTKAADDAVMAKLDVVHQRLVKGGALRPRVAPDADHSRRDPP